MGLGNPGGQYARTRHNVGAEVVACLAERAGVSLRRGRERALVAEVGIGGSRVALAFPQTFMNDSGLAVAALVRRHGIHDLAHLVVVHDELDLPLGRIKLKLGGGLAGHNGLRSVAAHLRSRDFARVRIGIGKPPGGARRGADHVLGSVRGAQRSELDVAVAEAADAVQLIVTDGMAAAMNAVNTRGG